MALPSIEQTSFLLLHEYEYKVSNITINNIGTMTLRHPQLHYASGRTTLKQRNNDDSGELHSAGTLAGTLILDRTNGNHDKQAIKYGMTCKLA